MNKKDLVKIGLTMIVALLLFSYVVQPLADKVADKMKS